ncbi:MAG: HPr family phosphocarrier protein [Treponema sp.]|jgi:phosphocarrier protein|nr:HPr family phosphocarrier protein [Treponema sp.]
MVTKVVQILNRAGIHARPAALIVQAIKNFKSSIYFKKDDTQINAKSIMGILMLGASYGSEIEMTAEGEDEQQAIDTLTRVFESKFEEE